MPEKAAEGKREGEKEKIETHYLLKTANHCKWPQRPEMTAENYYQAWRNKNTLDYITGKKIEGKKVKKSWY